MVLCVRASHGPGWIGRADGSTEPARVTAGSLRCRPDTRNDIPPGTDGRNGGERATSCARSGSHHAPARGMLGWLLGASSAARVRRREYRSTQ